MEKYRSRFSKTEKNRWAGLTISLCIVVAFYMLLSNLGNLKGFFNSFFMITSTVIIGAVIAYTVNPLAVLMNKRLEKLFKKNKNYSWIISASVSLILVLGLIVGLLFLISPMLIDNITNFAKGLSGYMNSLKELVANSDLNDDLKLSINGFINDQADLTKLVSRYVLGNDLSAAGVISFSAGTVSAAFNFIIGIILAFYFLIGKKKLLELLNEFFNLIVPTKHYENFSNVMNRLNSIFSR